MIESAPGLPHHQPTSAFLSSAQTNKNLQLPIPIATRDARHSIWSSSQLSELYPEHVREEAVETAEFGSAEPRHRRAHSFSTISEHEQSTSSKDRGELRIVIDRFDAIESTERPPVPSLEVPIPHYRLGTPQFNPDGMPVLRSSTYTHTSVSDNVPPSVSLRDESGNRQGPSTYNAASSLQPARTVSVAMSLFSGVAPDPDKSRFSSPSQRSAIYSLRHPIEPSVFDFLMEDLNDPAVVRYLPGTKDISAATPARIVAQISSESFMDYELVSDFFLTFRPYLSTTNLLALLSARLEWAINRLQDDGRIIRIRTFAALRHWILNYFVDDFVVNRDLRIQFCDQINFMYRSVTARSTGGISDVKILVDLKRCWHGRCSLYWDCPDLAGPDSPVIPGGVAGSRDLSRTRFSGINTPYPDVVVDTDLALRQTQPLASLALTGNHEHSTPVITTSHVRNVSSSTAHSVPVSMSDHSVQALSCSFPAKRSSLPLENINAPHPIPVQTQPYSTSTHPRSPTSISARRHPLHTHKRSGSFSDSIRDDRAPLSHANVEGQSQLLFQTTPTSGSLIRGDLLPPGDPTVGLTAPASPAFFAPYDELHEPHTRSSSDGNIRSLGASPGVRTIIGSIRRALHSRQLGPATPPHTTHGTAIPSLKGKTATLPVNIAFKSELYKERKAQPASRSSFRIDRLCEQTLKDYREAVGLGLEKSSNPPDGAGHHSKTTLEPRRLHVSKSQQERVSSQVTFGSKSILIVDDTGLDLPVMSGGVLWSDTGSEKTRGGDRVSARSSSTRRNSSSPRPAEVPVAFPAHLLEPASDAASQSSRPPTQHLSKTFALSRGLSFPRSGSMSSRLRKYASFHSGISRSLRGHGSELTPSESSKRFQAGDDKPLKRILRRRPGGDLRKIQNIHDLEPHLRPGSFVSDTSLSESVTSSVHHYVGRSFLRTSQARAVSTPPRFDLIHTHSSQHLRPSFEAAIADFSRIPDDEDGGVESALLKLEGRWQGSTTTADNSNLDHDVADHAELHENPNSADNPPWSDPVNPNDYVTTVDSGGTVVVESQREVTSQLYADSMVGSEYSYGSIPLLERGLSDESMKKPQSEPGPSDSELPRPLFGENASRDINEPESSHPSIQIVDETESIRRIPPGSTVPEITSDVDALNSDRAYLSDLSSELSVDVIDKSEGFENASGTDSLVTAALDIPSHPLTHPPSPPMTIQQRPSLPSYGKPETQAPSQAQLLTPGPSPTRKAEAIAAWNISSEGDRMHTHDHTLLNHVPFILAYDSKILAEQLTLVEKTALDEIDWKDLVEMKWNNNSSSALNWVQFLAEQGRKGIDLVVGRFNLMVKWILSEIVLTRNIQERAQTISKYIHVAAHARRMCNYSTMLQIAIALSSVDCTRLHNTWALVNPTDRRLLESMEVLIQPVRNFHELRVEMETANLQDGCIPFVGTFVFILPVSLDASFYLTDCQVSTSMI